MYTREQAEADHRACLERAEAAAASGDPLRAGLFRVEAGNCLDRVGMEKVHRPNLGPYSRTNPCYCLDCGKSREQCVSALEKCVPSRASRWWFAIKRFLVRFLPFFGG